MKSICSLSKRLVILLLWTYAPDFLRSQCVKCILTVTTLDVTCVYPECTDVVVQVYKTSFRCSSVFQIGFVQYIDKLTSPQISQQAICHTFGCCVVRGLSSIVSLSSSGAWRLCTSRRMENLKNGVVRTIQHILPTLQKRLSAGSGPVIIGLTGLQGSGKSTWAAEMADVLRRRYRFKVVQLSLDDFYHGHDKLLELRRSGNKLHKTRGQPGTHDEALARSFFDAIRAGHSTVKVPSFDKSRFNGEGDRVPEEEWTAVEGVIDIVIFEGWCVGFTPITIAEIERKRHTAATNSHQNAELEPVHTLQNFSLEDLEVVNTCLKRYCDSFMGPQHFDVLLQLATDRLRNVYTWRLQQEHALRKSKGSGMSDEGVSRFVQGYMPAYELYLEAMDRGFFGANAPGKQQVKIVLDRERNVLAIEPRRTESSL